MKNWNSTMIDRELFDLYEHARILFNDFFRNDESYNEIDLKAIKNLLKRIERDSKEIKEMIKDELND